MRKSILLLTLFINGHLIFAQNDSIKIEISNAGKGINSPFSDFAPVISADGSNMMFTSRRPITEREKKKNLETFETIYSSEYDWGFDVWSDAIKLSETVNTPANNNSAIGLSADGQRMLLFMDSKKGGDIYESVLSGTEWSKPVKLPVPINSDHHESSAAYSPDGNTIYFVSDRPGGIGGRDIWYCTKKKDGKWGDAKNLGKDINTDKHEEGVYMHPDGKTFYFGSQGHNSLGGLDIFTTEKKGVRWSKPVNMGEPINTPGDDAYFVLEASGKFAYYTSNHEGGLGEKDIYKITFTRIYKDDGKKNNGPKLILLKGVISDEKSGTPIEATIQVIDNEKNEILSTLQSNSSTGKYLVTLPAGKNYGIYVNAKGYLFHSENFDVNDTSDYTEVIKNIALKKLEVGNEIVLNNIFYDFDKSSLRDASKTELDKLTELMKENPTLTIELASHTDNKGSDAYNMTLSQARAQSVVDYLISKSIKPERLKAKGYGEAKPRATNDTEEGRQQNRRTEFKILSK